MCDDINQKAYVLDNVFYEFGMYLITYHELNIQSFSINQLIKNLLIESHQIHLRNLMDFFYSVRVTVDCMVVDDILKNYAHLPKNKEFWMSKNLINESITHLTYKRIPPEYRIPADMGYDLTWKTQKSVHSIFPIIRKKIRNFLRKLKDENIADTPYKQNILDSLKSIDIMLRINSLRGILSTVNFKLSYSEDSGE